MDLQRAGALAAAAEARLDSAVRQRRRPAGAAVHLELVHLDERGAGRRILASAPPRSILTFRCDCMEAVRGALLYQSSAAEANLSCRSFSRVWKAFFVALIIWNCVFTCRLHKAKHRQ